MDVRSNSRYFTNVYLISIAVTGGAIFVLVIATLVILCNFSRFASRRGASAVAWLVLLTQVIMSLLLGVVSGFDRLAPAVAFLIAALLWIPTISTYLLMTSSAWRTGFLISKTIFRGGGGGDDPPNVISAGTSGHGGGGGNSGSPTTATSGGGSSGAAGGGGGGDLAGVDGGRRVPCVGLISFVRAAARISVKRARVFMLATFFALLYTFVVILSLSGVCFCTNPMEITTWASRRARPHYCDTDKFCHLYATLGVNSTRMRIVGHVVASTAPARTWAELCVAASAISGECVTPVRIVPGKLVPHAHINEDLRYLSHVLLKDLNGSTIYKAVVKFEMTGSSTSVIHKEIIFKSLPDAESSETIEFVGGGDYHTGDAGMRTVMQSILRDGEPRFFYIGGDLSYANNVRYCFQRWDAFLHFFASLKTTSGLSIPLLTVAGNHESSGYLDETNPSKMFFYHQYLPQYDDDEPVDFTVSYHSHKIGRMLGIIGLDSQLYNSIESQVPFLRAKLAEFRQPTPTSPLSDTRFTIVFYHNPAYSSSRPREDDSSPLVREHFVPIFDEFKVPLALEFHDHTFKRTLPMYGGKVRSNDGTVYIGDGALGVDPRPIRNTDEYFAKESSTNYAQFISVFANGTAIVESYDIDGVLHDKVVLARRF